MAVYQLFQPVASEKKIITDMSTRKSQRYFMSCQRKKEKMYLQRERQLAKESDVFVDADDNVTFCLMDLTTNEIVYHFRISKGHMERKNVIRTRILTNNHVYALICDMPKHRIHCQKLIFALPVSNVLPTALLHAFHHLTCPVAILKTNHQGIATEGAILELRDLSGTHIHTFISQKQSIDISNYVKEGNTYVLRELQEPCGQPISKDIPFRIDDKSHTRQLIVLIDRQIKTCIQTHNTPKHTKDIRSDKHIYI